MAAERRAVGLVELLALAALGVVMTTATASLALAQLGCHDGLGALAIGGGAALALGVALRWWAGPITVETDRTEILLSLAVVAVAGVMYLPGAPYAIADKDPGIYVAHGFEIAHHGDVTVRSPVLATGDATLYGAGALLPGFWIDVDDPTSVTPQFFHLYPATLATAIDLAGPAGAWNLNPLLAVLATLAVALAVRRAAGTLPAALAGGLLAVCMMQVWQAKYPSTEILAELLLAGAILALVVAIETRWSGAAALAGAAIGTGFLARPDGVLYVLVAVAIGAGVAGLGWWDRRAWFGAGGLTLTLPYAWQNAFGLRAAYTYDNDIPHPPVLIGLTVLTGLVAFAVGRALRSRPVMRSEGAQRRIGVGILIASFAVLAVAGLRKQLLGVDVSDYDGRAIRSFNEMNLRWLALFLTLPGLGAMWLGIGVAFIRRWRASMVALVVPGLALLPIYLWDSRISPRLMWWVRRYVPGILPGIIVLIALFLAWALCHRRRVLQVAGGLLTALLAVVWLHQSLPLRAHREMAGSYAFGQAIAAVAPDPDALFAFTYPTPSVWDSNRNFPGAVWFVHDRLVALLPPAATMADVDALAAEFPDREIFVVGNGAPLGPGFDERRLELVLHHETALTLWEESTGARPSRANGLPVTADVWRLRAGG